ncbi:MAG: DUF882 domain-containing protein [Alphaproteobacteria bacterium]|nr:DUF882 domain-containing protein [Alphaproteobacteria bacterium]
MDDIILKNNAAAEIYRADRRGFLKRGLVFSAALGFWTPALAQAREFGGAAPVKGRSLHFINAHTNETFKGEYWYDGRYIPAAFKEIKTVLRDFRTDTTFPIDPRLMDVLFVVQRRLGNFNPFTVFSGYRSPATNEMLRETTNGVARGSLHMQGQAIDLNLPGTGLHHLRQSAVGIQAGGVGYYPQSDFVHIDTGRVRYW